MNNRVLITGGCGFIGANLIPKLEKIGYEINVLDNLSRGSQEYIKNSNAKIFIGDIRDKVIVSKSLQNVSSVIHLAAFGSVIESINNPEENFSVNVNGSFRILEECRKAGVKRIIFSSTGGAIMGNTRPPVNENTLPRPISPYGSSKLCTEAYCSSYAHSFNINITSLRFANVIGPISWHKKGVVTNFFKAILNNEYLNIYGDGNATRDFLYVEDLCEGIIQTIKSSISGYQTLHLSSGKEYTINEVADIILRITKYKQNSIIYNNKRIGEVERNFADFTLANKLIDFKPNFSLEEALIKTWDWFRCFGKS